MKRNIFIVGFLFISLLSVAQNGILKNTIIEKPWKLTQLYIDSLPVSDSTIANIQYIFTHDMRAFLFHKILDKWEANIYDFTCDEQTLKLRAIKVSDGSEVFNAQVTSFSDNFLVFVCIQADKNSPQTMRHVEYRFVPDYETLKE